MTRISLAAATLFILLPVVTLPLIPVSSYTSTLQEDAEETALIRSPVDGAVYKPYPFTYGIKPNLPSPFKDAGGREYLVVVTLDDRYAIVPVTVENALRPSARYSKGMQLQVDDKDFPTLAATGLHSERELDSMLSITGKPVAQISEDGRPGRFSAAGFIAEDEDILSVLSGDNRHAAALGLKHADLARPLYHAWNYILIEIDLSRTAQRWQPCKYLLSNDLQVGFRCAGSKGFQQSIFNDEIRGTWQIWLRRDLSDEESSFLKARYAKLSPEEMQRMIDSLSSLHTGEMVPYYIMRYGFYEGHTDYRADPIAIAFIFGLRSLEEIEAAFEGKLYEALTKHFSPPNP